MPRQSCLVTVLIIAGCASILAQKKTTGSEQAKAPAEKAAAALEADRILKEHRANAQSLLINLAADARNFSDATVRARTQARIADTLWATDRERSKTMFRAAWDAAEIADAESHARMQEDIRQQTGGGKGGYVVATPPNLRREVLEAAARRDQKLGEEFLAKYRDSKLRETDGLPRRANEGALDEATSQRFSVAEVMLENGEVAKAVQLADPALGSINTESVDFLSQLREKDAAAADQRYAAMLQMAAQNPQADANTVSLLASYIFTPRLYITFHGNGTSRSQMNSPIVPASVSPELRAAFFRAAAAVLMRPLPEQSVAGPDGQYLGIKRLMPLFEQFAPAETTNALRAQLDSLGAVASEGARNRDDAYMHPENPQSDRPIQFDREQSLLDRAERAKTSAERDQIYLELAMTMVDKDDQRARDYVDKIDEMELRDGVRGYVDASIAWKVISKKQIERAVELARIGTLTHLQRSWLLSQTADLIGVKDRERAASVLEDAATEARRIETGDADRPRAFFAIANVVSRINPSQVWTVMDDAIRAANSAEKFTGADGEITFRFSGKGTRAVHQHGFPDFDVSGIFGKLATEDYDRTVELARGLQGEAPRANAVIAVARSVLEEKKK